jgi:allantoicase
MNGSPMDDIQLPDLVSARVGGRALYANDEFFAPRNCLVKPEPAVFVAGKYTSHGKWMDGWETRRRRTPGHDWCVLALGLRGRIRSVDVDTSFFVGNQPERASLEACDLPGKPTRARLERASWTEVLPPSPLAPGSSNLFAVKSAGPFTHVRLNIFPDGGVARLRVRGEVEVDLARLCSRVVDLAAIENGGVVLAASDMHFGSKEHLILPGRAKSMAEGWETRRRRGPGHDWVILKLGAAGRIEKVEIDTAHFKGNYPDRASLTGCLAPSASLAELANASWQELLPSSKLRPNARHFYSAKQLRARGPFTHVRLRIDPDGGVSRLRLHGRAEEA